MSTTSPMQQPIFITNLVAGLRARLQELNGQHGELVVLEPNYGAVVGTLDNLNRTTVYRNPQVGTSVTNRAIHVSNILYNGDTVVILFVSNYGQPAETAKSCYYQPSVTMMAKEHLVSNVGYRSMEEIVNDIVAWL